MVHDVASVVIRRNAPIRRLRVDANAVASVGKVMYVT
jgi:hypothetical protein